MSLLDILGISQIRYGLAALPTRYRLAFDGAAVRDSKDGTIVQAGGSVLAASIGAGDWSLVRTVLGVTERVYQPEVGNWFGLGEEFAAAEVVLVSTALADPDDRIVIEGFGFEDIGRFRKVLVNMGPAPIRFQMPEDVLSGGARIAVARELAPNDTARLVFVPEWFEWLVNSGGALTLASDPDALHDEDETELTDEDDATLLQEDV